MNIRGQRHKGKSVVILGPGAIGGFLAALFWKNGYRVSCIAKRNSRTCIRESGIQLDSPKFGSFIAFPEVERRLTIEPEYLFITTKAPHLHQALERISPAMLSRSIVVPLLNGLRHIATIRDTLGCRVAVGMISIEVKRPTRCHVVHASQHARIELASDKDLTHEELKTTAGLLNTMGVDTKILKREVDVVWRKLVRLNAIATTTAAAQKPIGFVRSDTKWRQKLLACLREGATVSFAEGVKIDPYREIELIDSFHPDLSTSLQRDIARSAPSELDAITGAVIQLAGKHGIECPVTVELMRIIKQQISV